MTLPDLWFQAVEEEFESGAPSLLTWWDVFDDAILAELIDQAGAGNLTLKQSIARIEESRAILGISKSDWWPDVDGIGNVFSTRTSEGIIPEIPGLDRTSDQYNLGLDGFWELDVWGRVRRSVESSGATYEATIEDYRDTMVVLYAEIAITYLDVRELQQRIRYAQENVQSQRSTLTLTQDREAAGLAPALDVSQAELNLYRTASNIPSFQASLTQSMQRLAVLIGKYPSALYELLEPVGKIPRPPPSVAIGLPAELLRQRPDIRSAERTLAAQTARIGVATAELFPEFSLSGTFSFQSTDSSDWLETGSRAYSFGPAFRWNLFAGGRVLNQIRAEEARTRESLYRYEETVLLAVEEVEGSMVGYARELQRQKLLRKAVDAGKTTVNLVKDLYRNGLTNFQNVLDSERSLAQEQDRLAVSRGTTAKFLVNVYKAMGGGWDPAAPPPIEEE